MPLTTRIALYARLVKLEHTVFALPFTLAAVLLAMPLGEWPPVKSVVWVILAMVGGRTLAMALNRLIDAAIDAQNPRTATREIPAGLVRRQEAIGLALASFALLLWATWHLPYICWELLPVAVVLLVGYSYTKRFTSLCHGVLGITLGSGAIAGWLAIAGQWDRGLPLLLGLAVACWSAGFDIIYACQDVEFDRATGLHSIPARLGVARALGVSRWLHGVAVAGWVALGLGYSAMHHPIGGGYWVGVVLIAAMLAYEQSLVRPNDLSKVNAAFFTLNGVVSLLFFACVLVDKGLQTRPV
jgi:4-hydroxybenzoate polyprenyltransferase